MLTQPLRNWLYLIFTLAVVFRLGLAILNNGGANDWHIEVSEKIEYHEDLPNPYDCWQCYHPKLFHITIAGLWKTLQIQSKKTKIISAQLFNAFLGIATIILLWIFLSSLKIRGSTKVWTFAFLALNPRLIAIQVQITNDTLIIFLGCLISLSLIEIAKKPDKKWLITLIICSILGAMTKSNAAVLILASSLIYFILGTINYFKKHAIYKSYFLHLGVYLLFTIPLSAIGGEYVYNYKTYGKAVVYNTRIGDPPKMWEETSFRRDGIRSIATGFFTFRLADMVRNPQINNDKVNYPKHRTSFWSQVYGRTHFVFFDNHPGEWYTNHPDIMNIGRLSFILGLIPTSIFILGLSLGLSLYLKRLPNKIQEIFLGGNEWLHHILFLGFMSALIVFTYIGRDFSFMKVIYIFPALLSIGFLFTRGLEWLYEKIQSLKVIRYSFHFLSALLLIFYLIPLTHLGIILFSVF